LKSLIFPERERVLWGYMNREMNGGKSFLNPEDVRFRRDPNKTVRRTFVMDTGITPEIIKTIADIAKTSLTSYGERKRASEPYYELLKNAMEANQQDNQSKLQSDENI